ncbi:polynucleotide 5'-hydroxyl-kinase NOL9-like isoform X2 [Clytia hemisphaerica]
MPKEKRVKRITRSTIRSLNKPLNPATTTTSSLRGRGPPNTNTTLQNEEKELARRYKLQRKKMKLKRLYKKVKRDLKQERTKDDEEELKPGDLSTASDTGADTADDDTVEADCSSPFVCDEMSADEKAAECNDEKMTKMDKEELRLWTVEDGQLLFLKQKQMIAISGSCIICCLFGTVEINGKILTENDEEFHDLVSFKGSTLLAIENRNDIEIDKNQLLKKINGGNRRNRTGLESDFIDKLDKITSCIWVMKKKSALGPVLNQLNGCKIGRELQFHTEPFEVAVLKTEKWKKIVDEQILNSQKNISDQQCTVLFCGGKDVGKSSFSKFTVNRLLNKQESVYFLECDCGQTEFTPPAVLSLVKITKPLFGTTHIKPVKAFFYGYISTKDNPNDYIHLLKELHQFYLNECDTQAPLIVNTQGWVRGLGLSLLIDLLRILDPSHVVQIQSDQESRNLPFSLDDEVIDTSHGWVTTSESVGSCRQQRSFITLDTVKQTDSLHKGVFTRNRSITRYFTQMYHHPVDVDQYWIPPPLSTIKPYVINTSDIALHIMNQNVTEDLMLMAFNVSLVALAKVPDDLVFDSSHSGLRLLKDQPRAAEYLGLAIIRNIEKIDALTTRLYIITPEPVDVLDQVNVLLKGNIQLSQSYFTQDPRGKHPYFSYDYDFC